MQGQTPPILIQRVHLHQLKVHNITLDKRLPRRLGLRTCS